MLVFCKCVAESALENGVRGLIDMVPGGNFARDLMVGAWKKYRERQKDAAMRAEIQKLAAMSFEEAQKAAVEVAKEVAARAPVEDRLILESYLSQVPGTVRQSLKRPADLSGKTVPNGFVLGTPDAIARLLPARALRGKPGDPVAGLGGWSLVRLLGAGGFGEVWLARNQMDAAEFGAVKFCHGQQGKELKHEHALIRRVMSAGGHPNIVPLLTANLDGESPWLLYEYVQGTDLGDWSRQWQTQPIEERVRQAVLALRQLCPAIAHFHTLSPPVVHRDLKPSNILVDRVSKRVKITDFGIGAVAAKAVLADGAKGTTRAGQLGNSLRGAHTPLYASPQQRDGDDPDPRDDVHAMGVIAYQLLTGQVTRGPGTDFGDDLRERGVDPALIALIGECVAQNPTRRPADASELLLRLRALATAPTTSPLGQEQVPEQTAQPASSSPPGVVLPTPEPKSLIIPCTKCGTRLKAPFDALGKSLKCPNCGAVTLVSEASAPLTPRAADFAPDKVDFVCPACRGRVCAPASLQGAEAECPKCNATVSSWPAPTNAATRSPHPSLPTQKIPRAMPVARSYEKSPNATSVEKPPNATSVEKPSKATESNYPVPSTSVVPDPTTNRKMLAQLRRDIPDVQLLVAEVMRVTVRLNPVNAQIHTFSQHINEIEEATPRETIARVVRRAMSSVDLSEAVQLLDDAIESIASSGQDMVMMYASDLTSVWPDAPQHIRHRWLEDPVEEGKHVKQQLRRALEAHTGDLALIQKRFRQLRKYHPEFQKLLTRTRFWDTAVALTLGIFGGAPGLGAAHVWADWRCKPDAEFVKCFGQAVDQFGKSVQEFTRKTVQSVEAVVSALLREVEDFQETTIAALEGLVTTHDMTAIYRKLHGPDPSRKLDAKGVEFMEVVLTNLREQRITASSEANIRAMLGLRY